MEKREELLTHREVGWTIGPLTFYSFSSIFIHFAPFYFFITKARTTSSGGSSWLLGILDVTQDACNIVLDGRTTGFATLESNVKLTVERHYFRVRFEQILQNPSLKITCIIRRLPPPTRPAMVHRMGQLSPMALNLAADHADRANGTWQGEYLVSLSKTKC